MDGCKMPIKKNQIDTPTLEYDSSLRVKNPPRYTTLESDREPLLIINIVLQTAYLKSCPNPKSLLLIAKSGIGKSRLLSPLSRLDFVSYVNDITPKYLVEFLRRAKTGEKKFLVIPDYTSCLSHGMNTRNTLNAILRGMTEEGILDLSDYHLEFQSDTPVRAGLLTAITIDSYAMFRESWKTTGFLSRLIPVSFDHSIATKEKIMNNINARLPDAIDKVKLEVKKRPRMVECPEHLLRQLRQIEENLALHSGSLPYRHQIQLNAMTEALAVMRNHAIVTQEDIDTISHLSNWINYDFNPL
jgi:hypothetical protein